MITYKDALELAQQYIRNIKSNVDSANFVVCENAAREEDFGWIFPWNDKRFLESKDPRYSLAGNQPIVVLRANGNVQYLPTFGTKRDIASRIKLFAESLNNPKNHSSHSQLN